MRFGVREICDVTFKALQGTKIGSMEVRKGQPVLYIDTAKTSTIEGAATTVYATGGRGNSRLIAWEGEKTLTFTVEDALLSPIGFAMLSGAGLLNLESKNAQVHCTATVFSDNDGVITLDDAINLGAPCFVMELEGGSIVDIVEDYEQPVVDAATKTTTITLPTDGAYANKTFFVDYYVTKTSGVTEIQIDAENFAGYYYVEGSTLFRRESDGVDLPAEICFPKVKIQSNFTFQMASSGDPSTFTFTMDAFPAYTMFERTKKVLCAIQIIDPKEQNDKELKPVTTLDDDEVAMLDGEAVDGGVKKNS